MPSLTSAIPATAQVAVGHCYLTLNVSGVVEPPPPSPPLTPTTLTVNGGGTCLVNGVDDVGALVHGSLTSLEDTATWSCAGGVSTGTLTFDISHEEFQGTVDAVVAVVAAAGLVGITATNETATFGGAGSFLQDTASTTTCPNSEDPVFTMTWCGKFGFALADTPVPAALN